MKKVLSILAITGVLVAANPSKSEAQESSLTTKTATMKMGILF